MVDSLSGYPFRRLLWSPAVYRECSSSAGLMDWLETPTSYIIKINVPGFSKDAIKVQIEDGNVLHVRAEGAKEDGESGPTKEAVWHVSERRVGGLDLSRLAKLPENVKANQVKSQVENGVLTVAVCTQYIWSGSRV